MSADAAIGLLAKNWPSLNEKEPAIIVNPAATPLDALAWCWGEIESLRHAAEVCSESSGSVDGDTVDALFVHRIAPLSAVMRDAIQALEREMTQRQNLCQPRKAAQGRD